MSEETAAIDTSPIGALLAIQQKQDQLQQLVERAESSRSSVSDAVFRRVSEDYAARRRSLEAEALPLRSQARQEHARLEPIHERLRRQVEEARLDKEELEFRHSVGELTDDAFAERGKAAEELLATRQRDFAEADALKQRFLGVMGPPDVEPEPEPEVPTAEFAPPPPTTTTVEAGAPPEATWMAAGPAMDPRATAELPGPHAEGTMAMRVARFVAEGAGPAQEYQLRLRTTIGRTPDNDIAISDSLVSRHHAVVTFSSEGYTIADLKSGNGTFVNDLRIEEHLLAEGDRVKIGSTVFSFHPATG